MTATTKIPAISADISRAMDGTPIELILVFGNGTPLGLKVSDLSESIKAEALMHGLKQKLVDAAAISRDPDTGRSATVEDKFDAVKEVYDRLLSGQWNKVREGGSGGGNGGLLFAALVRLYDGRKTEEEIRAFLAEKTDAEQVALRTSTRIAPIIAAIKAERAARKGAAIDGDELLSGLED